MVANTLRAGYNRATICKEVAMPSFPRIEIDEFKYMGNKASEKIGKYVIETHPKGIRGKCKRIKPVSNMLKKKPYVTGDIPRFNLKVCHSSKKGNLPFNVIVYEMRNSDRPLEIENNNSENSEYSVLLNQC